MKHDPTSLGIEESLFGASQIFFPISIHAFFFFILFHHHVISFNNLTPNYLCVRGCIALDIRLYYI